MEIVILVTKTESGFSFRLVKGLDDIRKVNPSFNIGEITVKYASFQSMEETWGLGSVRSDVERIFGLNGHFKCKFINDSEEEV